MRPLGYTAISLRVFRGKVGPTAGHYQAGVHDGPSRQDFRCGR